jgi:hypothetical protein
MLRSFALVISLLDLTTKICLIKVSGYEEEYHL